MDTGIPYAIIRATLDLGAWTVCSIVWPGRCGVSPSSAAATTGFSPSSPKDLAAQAVEGRFWP